MRLLLLALLAGCARRPAASPPPIEVPPPGPLAPVTLSIAADGRAWIGGAPVALPEDEPGLLEALRGPLAPYAGAPVALAIDQRVTYGRVIAVMQALQALGFADIRLAVAAEPGG